jgi:hypothetical protein
MMALSAGCKRRSPTTQPALPDHDRPPPGEARSAGFHAAGHSRAAKLYARPALRCCGSFPFRTRQASRFGRLAERAARAARTLRSDRPRGRVSTEWSGARRCRYGRLGPALAFVFPVYDGGSGWLREAMTATETLVHSIDERFRQLNEEIRTLTAARGALERREAPPVKRRPRSTGSRASRRDNRTGADAPAQSAGEAVAAASSEIAPRAPQEPQVRARPKRGQRRRSVGVVAAGQLEALLSENPEITTSALAERANASREQVLTALHELETARRVRRSGQRRSTRWHAITDEERIAARAAELAARSKTPASRVRARV